MKDIMKYSITVIGVLIPVLFIGWILAIPVLSDIHIAQFVFIMFECLLLLFTIGFAFLIAESLTKKITFGKSKKKIDITVLKYH